MSRPFNTDTLSDLEQKIIQELQEWNKKGRANGHCTVQRRNSQEFTKKYTAVRSSVSRNILFMGDIRMNIVSYSFTKAYLQWIQE